MDLNKLVNCEIKERNSRDVGAYVASFKSLSARTQMSAYDQMVRFKEGLPAHIYRALSISGNIPADFNAWVERSLQAYAAYEQVRQKEAVEKALRAASSSTPLSSSSSSSSKPAAAAQTAPRTFAQTAQAPRSQHVPIDVDATQAASQGDPRKCFNCNKIEHISRNCPEPRRPRQPRIAASEIPPPDASGGVDLFNAMVTPSASISASQKDPAQGEIIEGLMKRITDLEKRLQENF